MVNASYHPLWHFSSSILLFTNKISLKTENIVNMFLCINMKHTGEQSVDLEEIMYQDDGQKFIMKAVIDSTLQ
jgi:hypothetical protein